MSAAAVIILRRKQLIRRFAEQGATSANKAISFAELGVRRSRVFEQMLARGVFVGVKADRFFLNEEAAQAFLERAGGGTLGNRDGNQNHTCPNPARGTTAPRIHASRPTKRGFTGKRAPRFLPALPVGERAGASAVALPSLASFLPTPSTPEDDNRSPTVTYAEVLPEEPGKEKLEFESGFNKPTVNGQWQKCVGRCFARRNGQWVQAWQTEPLDVLFQPLPLAWDFDGDACGRCGWRRSG